MRGRPLGLVTLFSSSVQSACPITASLWLEEINHLLSPSRPDTFQETDKRKG